MLIVFVMFTGIMTAQNKTITTKSSQPAKKKAAQIEKFKVSGRAFYQGAWCKGTTPTLEQEQEVNKLKLLSIAFYLVNDKSKKRTYVYCDGDGYFEAQLPKGEYFVESLENLEVGTYVYKGKDTLRNSTVEDFGQNNERIIGDIKITDAKTDLVLGFYQKCNGKAE